MALLHALNTLVPLGSNTTGLQTPAQSTTTTSSFLTKLPLEIRNQIYQLYWEPPPRSSIPIIHPPSFDPGFANNRYPALTQVCSQLRYETLSFYERKLPWRINMDRWSRTDPDIREQFECAFGNRQLFVNKIVLRWFLIRDADTVELVPDGSIEIELNLSSGNLRPLQVLNISKYGKGCEALLAAQGERISAMIESTVKRLAEKRQQGDLRGQDFKAAIDQCILATMDVQFIRWLQG